MILDCMVMCFVLVLFLHSLLLMMATNCLLVVIRIIITTVEEKSGDAPLVGRTVMGKVIWYQLVMFYKHKRCFIMCWRI